MLPTELDKPSKSHVLVCVIAPDNSDFAEIWANIGANPLFDNPLILAAKNNELSNLRLVCTSDSNADLTIVESCDALVIVLDGVTGLGSGSISAWTHARDLNTPRHFLATGVVRGRADFDELAAMATRTMEPDLLVRYLPIDADDEDSLAGVFDVLTSEIHQVVTGDIKIKPGDPEHVTLTADRRDDLFDQLAHLGLDDQALENHRAGLPISITKLELAWNHPDAISITPIENGVGLNIFNSWLKTLRPIWIPAITLEELTSDVTHTEKRVGFAIANKLARMWSPQTSAQLQCWNLETSMEIDPKFEDDCVLIADSIVAGMTISAHANDCELVTPTFE
jgi:hypothetical protein